MPLPAGGVAKRVQPFYRSQQTCRQQSIRNSKTRDQQHSLCPWRSLRTARPACTLQASRPFCELHKPTRGPNVLKCHSHGEWSHNSNTDSSAAAQPGWWIRCLSFLSRMGEHSKVFGASLKEAAPFAALMLLLTAGNTMADQAKDVVVLNVLGAKCIPFLQVYAVLPLSIAFLWGYQRLQQVFSRRVLFPVIISILVVLKLLTVYFLLPNALMAMSAGPASGGLIGIQSYVLPALFYGCCELYGDIVLGLLFWGFAIQATPPEKVDNMFPLYCAGANIAQILTGGVLWMVAKAVPGAVQQTQVLCSLCAVACLLAMLLHQKLSSAPSIVAAAEEVEMTKETDSKAEKPNPITAFQYCRQNADIRPLAIMAAAAGIISNTLEIAWKVHLSQWLTTPELMTSFMGKVSSCAGLATLCLIPLSTVAFRRLGWSRTAKATPNLLLLAGGPFFLACVAYQTMKHFDIFVSSQQPLLVAISVAGAALYIGFRSAKFALYKPAEEMVYKKLDQRAQTEGKASVDVVAAQFGKTGSSLGTQGLLLALPWVSMVGVMGVLSGAFLTVGSKWRNCLTSLSPKMDKLPVITAAETAADAFDWGLRLTNEWGDKYKGEWGAVESAISSPKHASDSMCDTDLHGSHQVWRVLASEEDPDSQRDALAPVLA